MLFQFDIVENFLRPLGQMGGFLILILGIIWIIFAMYEAAGLSKEEIFDRGAQIRNV